MFGHPELPAILRGRGEHKTTVLGRELLDGRHAAAVVSPPPPLFEIAAGGDFTRAAHPSVAHVLVVVEKNGEFPFFEDGRSGF